VGRAVRTGEVDLVAALESELESEGEYKEEEVPDEEAKGVALELLQLDAEPESGNEEVAVALESAVALAQPVDIDEAVVVPVSEVSGVKDTDAVVESVS